MNRLAALILGVFLALPAAFAADVPDWSTSAPDNTAPAPDGIPDNVQPSKVHGIMREIQASVKRWWERANAITSTGSANSHVLTYIPPVTECRTGEGFVFFPGYTNTGSTILTVGACSAPVKIGTSILTGGELVTGRVVSVYYDGTAYQLLSGGGTGGAPSEPGGNLALNGGGCVLLNGGGCVALNQ